MKDFFSLKEETQHLDLSIVPESFRQKIFENSKNMQRRAEKLKKSIEQYEKSIGKDSSRGSIRSAPRKDQWALLAAENLNVQEWSRKLRSTCPTKHTVKHAVIISLYWLQKAY